MTLYYVIVTSNPSDKRRAKKFDFMSMIGTEFESHMRGRESTTDRLFFGYKSDRKALRAMRFLREKNAGNNSGIKLYLYRMNEKPNPDNLHTAERLGFLR